MCKRGDTITLTLNGKPVDIDRCLAPLVMALNDAGFATVASCCGHGIQPGRISLADGRELFIARSYDEAQAVSGTFPPLRGKRL